MSPRTVLIANPCDAERCLLAHALASRGYEVLQATCAKEAIATAQTSVTQLVLLDTLNWEAPALTALAVLKHHPSTCRVPVVVFGNPKAKEQVAEAIQKGAATWLGRKGFELERFADKLAAVIDKHLEQAAKAPSPVGPQLRAAGAGLDKLDRAAVQRMLQEAGKLPAFEFSITDSVTTTCAKEQTIPHLAGIVERDPLLMITVLGMARIGPGPGSGVLDAQAALNQIGGKEFYRMVEALPGLRIGGDGSWDPGCYWAHSVATARIAGLLSRVLDLASPSSAVTAGLVHDLGLPLLAHFFPRHYGDLIAAAMERACVDPAWERSIIGAHHGEIAAWVLQHYGVPGVLGDAALVHHAGASAHQALTPLSRVVSFVVQAADCLAYALFPADPPLGCLANPAEEFESALAAGTARPQAVLDAARKIVAELLTEMSYLFPQASANSFFYRAEPLDRVAYYSPASEPIDVVRVFLEVRSSELVPVPDLSPRTLPAGIPLVINLSRVQDLPSQIEVLTSAMAIRLLDSRPGVVLLPGTVPNRAIQTLLTASWQAVAMPAHPAKWMQFLAGKARKDAGQLNVA